MAKLNQAYHISSYPAVNRQWTALNGWALKYRVLQLKGITFIAGLYANNINIDVQKLILKDVFKWLLW